MTDANTVSASLATLGPNGWVVNEIATGVQRAFRVTANATVTIAEAGVYLFSGCAGGGGAGNGEAALNGGGGGGGGAGRARLRVPIHLNVGDVVAVFIGSGGAIHTAGNDTYVTVNGVERLRLKGGAQGGNGAAGAGGVGGAVTGSFQGSPNVVAGGTSANRSTFPDMHSALCTTGSGGGAAATNGGLGVTVASDTSIASTGLSGGGHGGDTCFDPYATAVGRGGLGGAAGVSGTPPTADAWGVGGGAGGAAASPGAGTPGNQGVMFIEFPKVA